MCDKSWKLSIAPALSTTSIAREENTSADLLYFLVVQRSILEFKIFIHFRSKKLGIRFLEISAKNMYVSSYDY